MVNENRIVENFLDMVKIPSPSKNERKMGDYLIEILKELGLEVEEDNAGIKNGGNCGNIIGILKSQGRKKYLFSAHMDTVVPCEKITPIIENGIIKSDGTSILGGDDKGGIAAIIEMLRVIKEKNLDHPEIVVVFSMAEEIGLLGAKAFEVEKYNIDFGFILDSSGKPGKIITKAPSAARGVLKVIGKPAHAGISPENGINALTVAAHAITKIKLGRVDSETTSNIGVVSGGQATNIVMPTVELQYEARSLSNEKLENLLKETFDIFSNVAEEFGAKFENEVNVEYPGFVLDDNEEVITIVKEACERAGITSETVSSGGGSDTNIYNNKGIPAVNLAVGMTKVHTLEEYIEISDLVKLAKILVEIIKG
ncbi:M20/M25/M40 family metallo-hydrolase [uncultured Cetobacterium sp.]|uniref:M20/M25/M40 family metallo-hydrolase n=1 Tax=uncultured Cetobacterium sp. TaxID=527638 RepID=UPI00262B9504|nr:M20/M25/M40 family metallo-hydrolase [uncultured Cetobacterium sp.]